MAETLAAARGEGLYPDRLIEVDLMDRFGWSLAQVREADLDEVLASVRASNLYAALRRVVTFVESGGKISPAPSDWAIWQWATDIRAELYPEAGGGAAEVTFEE